MPRIGRELHLLTECLPLLQLQHHLEPDPYRQDPWRRFAHSSHQEARNCSQVRRLWLQAGRCKLHSKSQGQRRQTDDEGEAEVKRAYSTTNHDRNPGHNYNIGKQASFCRAPCGLEAKNQWKNIAHEPRRPARPPSSANIPDHCRQLKRGGYKRL